MVACRNMLRPRNLLDGHADLHSAGSLITADTLRKGGTVTKPIINYGQAEIQAFNNAVSAGEIHYEEGVARQAAQHYDDVANKIGDIREEIRYLEEAQGFGGFQTGIELQKGFRRKATDGIQVLGELIDGAMRLKESYLRAGGLTEEADQVNSQRIKLFANSEGMER